MSSRSSDDQDRDQRGRDQQRQVARQTFEFITVSGDTLRGDESVRQRVRSHAQADYRRRNPAPPRRPLLTVDLDVSAWLTQPRSLDLIDVSSDPVVFGPVVRGDACRFDEAFLGTLPEPRRRRAWLLWNHLFDGTCVVFKSMLEVGFLEMVRGSGALTQMLSTAAWHRDGDKTDANGENEDYVSYSVMATQSLRRSLSDPLARADNDVIITILACAAFANLICDAHLTNIHLDGLSQVLGHRGGLESLDSMPVIRIMIFWVDLNGAYLQDTQPRYPQPSQLLSTVSQLRPATPAIISRAPSSPATGGGPEQGDPAISRICDALRQVSSLIDAGFAARGDDFWGVILFPGFNLSPILHDLLSMPRIITTDGDGDGDGDVRTLRREYFRLAAILYVTELSGKFGIPPSLGAIYATKMQALLLRRRTSPGMLLPPGDASDTFFLWGLVVAAASSSCATEAQRLEFRDLLSVCLRRRGIIGPGTKVPLMSNFMWCEAVYGGSLLELAQRVLLSGGAAG